MKRSRLDEQEAIALWLTKNTLTAAPVSALLPGETAPRVSAAWLERNAGNRKSSLLPAQPSARPAIATISPRSVADPPDPPGKRIAHVWTDGACGPTNPGQMGIGVVVEVDGLKETHSESLGYGTNNIAEIAAVQRGVAMASNRGLDGIVVHTDSQYAIGVVSKNWKAKKNVDLINATKRAVAACGARVEFRWVKGHSGVEGNEIADELAEAATG